MISDATTSDSTGTRSKETNAAILRRWARRILPWALLSLSAWLILDSMQQGAPMEPGTPAPALVAELDDGTQFDLDEHRGKVVVLNFWASWCPPCRAEAPALSAVHRDLGDHGSVIGISMDPGELDAVSRTGAGLGMRYPIARTDQATIDRFQVTRLPTTYVVAPDGHVVWSAVGEVSHDELEAAVDRALRHR